VKDGLTGSPFDELRVALNRLHPALDRHDPGATVRADPHRARRTGIPEIVHAEHKEPAVVAETLVRLAATSGRALASRVTPEMAEAIRDALDPALEGEWFPVARALVAKRPGAERPVTGGRVGVLSAGTSDVPVAAEASLIAAEMGTEVHEAWDVGVAGLHRLVEPLERFATAEVAAIVVAAGMDGALPSVVAGLVDVPVIGLPTSVGYGVGGGGVGALTTMLQSCAPGLVVVNIDNGVGAGATAALIANREARSRAEYR
jgi:NCAIR mutase (PurE)-related protein